MYRGIGAVLLLVLLTACGQAPSAATLPVEVPHASATPTTPTTSSAPPGSTYTPEPPQARPASCRGQRVRVQPHIIQPALGARYFLLTVSNCGGQSVTLPALPELRMVSRGGESSTVDVEPERPGQEPLTLKPGGTAYIGLRWRTVGRGPARAHLLKVTFVGPETTLIGDFDFGLGSVITVYPWSRTPEGAWHR